MYTAISVTEGVIYWNDALPVGTFKDSVPCRSNAFKFSYANTSTPYTCYNNGGRYLYFSIRTEDTEYGTTYTTYKEAITAWLAKTFSEENPLIVKYELAAPIETSLSDEEIAAYKALHTNYPNTTIYNDEGAYTEVKYVADTKNYVDNKIANEVAKLTAAIITE